MKLKDNVRALILPLLVGVLLSAPSASFATAIANSTLSFFNLDISPASGDLELFLDWELEAFAQAQNSLGEFDQDFDFSFFGGFVSADAAVTWASGHGDAAAPTFFPPDLNVAGNANTDVNVPGCDPKSASSLGRGTLFNAFVISGGTGTVDVGFSTDIAGDKFVLTDECGVLAETELIYALEIFDDLPLVGGDPQDSLILFHENRLVCSGPNCQKSESVSETLSATRTLEFDVPYFFGIEIDSESVGVVVPEPPTIALLLGGLAALLGLRRKKREGTSNRAFNC